MNSSVSDKSEKHISFLHLLKTCLSDYRFLCKILILVLTVIFFSFEKNQYLVQGYMDYFFFATQNRWTYEVQLFCGNAKIKLSKAFFVFILSEASQLQENPVWNDTKISNLVHSKCYNTYQISIILLLHQNWCQYFKVTS